MKITRQQLRRLIAEQYLNEDEKSSNANSLKLPSNFKNVGDIKSESLGSKAYAHSYPVPDPRSNKIYDKVNPTGRYFIVDSVPNAPELIAKYKFPRTAFSEIRNVDAKEITDTDYLFIFYEIEAADPESKIIPGRMQKNR